MVPQVPSQMKILPEGRHQETSFLELPRAGFNKSKCVRSSAARRPEARSPETESLIQVLPQP